MYMHVHVYMCVYTLCPDVHACIHMCIYIVSRCIYMHVYMFVYTLCPDVHACMYTCVCIHCGLIYMRIVNKASTKQHNYQVKKKKGDASKKIQCTY